MESRSFWSCCAEQHILVDIPVCGNNNYIIYQQVHSSCNVDNCHIYAGHLVLLCNSHDLASSPPRKLWLWFDSPNITSSYRMWLVLTFLVSCVNQNHVCTIFIHLDDDLAILDICSRYSLSWHPNTTFLISPEWYRSIQELYHETSWKQFALLQLLHNANISINVLFSIIWQCLITTFPFLTWSL